jgi:subtilisin family serine protease
VYVVELPDDVDVRQAAARYAADPAVEYAHPDALVALTLVPDDPFLASTGTWGQPYPDLWGLHTIGAPAAWDTANGTGTIVAVVDTGIDPTHPDLAANVWSNAGEIAGNGIDDDGNGYVDDVAGWDFVGDDNEPLDTDGHGTHVAGTAAAVGDNGVGVAGVAWGARVMPVRAFVGRTGLTSDAAAAIGYAAENGADVINNSWGGFADPPSPVLVDAVNTALGLGAVVVAAAGNEQTDVDLIEPARLPDVIAVGAVGPGDVLAAFSNRGDALSVTAPGIDVLSLLAAGAPPGGPVVGGVYQRLLGTSMAAPHVTGLAAVLLSALPALTPEEVRWHLELNAERIDAPGYEGQAWNPLFGWGRIDAARVFDPPPATTRLRPSVLELHAFAGASVPDAATTRLVFTTPSPIAWTLAAPPWLVPSATAGSGPADVVFTLDAVSMAPGTQTASIAVTAPDAVDGGGNVPATLHAHRDARLGAEASFDAGGSSDPFGPVLAGNGQRALLVWQQPPGLRGALLDAAGTAGAPFVIASDPFVASGDGNSRVASDGDGFFVVWVEREIVGRFLRNQLLGRRLSASGAALDPEPLRIASSTTRLSAPLFLRGVSFDGRSYAVLWDRNGSRRRQQFRVYWIGRDGSLEERRRLRAGRSVNPLVDFMLPPAIACGSGDCLVAWSQFELTATGMDHHSYALPLRGRRPDYAAAGRILEHAQVTTLASDGTDYLAVGVRPAGLRFEVCEINPPIYSGCVSDVVAGRVTRAGVPLDPGGIRVNGGPSGGRDRAAPSVAFDGASYVTAFLSADVAVRRAHLFLARIAPDGTVRDGEQDGLLVTPGPTALLSAHVGALPDQALVAWTDRRTETPGRFHSLRVQRLGTGPP